MCRANSPLECSPIHIGGGEFLLPRESTLHLIHLGTLETTSTSVFSGCREWKREQPAAAVTSKPAPPAGTALRVLLRAAIDTNIAAAGDAVAATTFRPALDPRESITQNGETPPLPAVPPERPSPFACAGQSARGGVSAVTAAAGPRALIAGRRPPPPSELREALPIAPAEGKRSIVRDGQKLRLTITPKENAGK